MTRAFLDGLCFAIKFGACIGALFAAGLLAFFALEIAVQAVGAVRVVA